MGVEGGRMRRDMTNAAMKPDIQKKVSTEKVMFDTSSMLNDW